MTGLFKSAVGALAVGLIVGCADTVPDDTEVLDTPPSTEQAPVDPVESTTDEVSLADIVAEPANFVGRTVTIVADVEEVFGPRAFALDEDAIAEGGIDNDLLVLNQAAANLSDIDDQWLNNKVRVTGTVSMVTIVEVEQDVGWDLEPELESELEGREAVLIATSVERVEG